MAGARTCPKCGGAMPGGVLEGLCPNCASKTELPSEKRAASTATPGVTAIPAVAQPDEQGLVTLLQCETLAEADAIRAALEAAGISVILAKGGYSRQGCERKATELWNWFAGGIVFWIVAIGALATIRELMR